MQPTVSVILPVYNAKKYINQTIRSILQQTYSDFELLIVDDCPTDGTMQIVEGFTDKRIRIIHNKRNMGIAYTRNCALENSRGTYIALMDHDDIALPERLEKQVQFFERNKDIDVVGGRIQLIGEKDEPISDVWSVNTDPQILKALLLFINPYSNSEVMFRKQIVKDNLISYKDNMLGMEDFRFWIECSKVGKFSNVDSLVQYRRIMESSETGSIMQSKLNERLELYAQLQEYSFELSGFKIEKNDMDIIQQVVSDGCGMCRSGTEMRRFYEALSNVILQARKLNVDFLDGLKTVARSLLISKSTDMDSKSYWS